jgi:hypothetical protein
MLFFKIEQILSIDGTVLGYDFPLALPKVNSGHLKYPVRRIKIPNLNAFSRGSKCRIRRV